MTSTGRSESPVLGGATGRLLAALAAGRLAQSALRGLGLGGGTTLPGHIARRIDPTFLRQAAGRLPQGVVLVSGTNGKTTTARLLAHLATTHGWRVVHNRAGANLLPGLAAALAPALDWQGRPRADLGVFEVDEATLPLALAEMPVRLVVLTNLFRDQLDRYGELDSLRRRWAAALADLPAGARLVLNADDPLVASLGQVRPAAALFYGLEEPALCQEQPDHAFDARLCPCGHPLQYQGLYYAHLGQYRCPACGFARPAPQVAARRVVLQGLRGATVELAGQPAPLHSPLPGLYNVYNLLAVLAAAQGLGIAFTTVGPALARFPGVFGRLERVRLAGHDLLLALIKNPVGCNAVLRTLLSDPAPGPLAIAINDHFADGTDISWLWDADFELLRDWPGPLIVGGTRAEDMRLRLKYADLPPERIVLTHGPDGLVQAALDRAGPGEPVYLLLTYTALLEVRAVLSKRGAVAPFWAD
jgi:UDP-N-acetylmuramyl tripeptide synthase